MKINLPEKVLMIINNLQFHGYEAYAVGGCVRDSILARQPEGLGYHHVRKTAGDQADLPEDGGYRDRTRDGHRACGERQL